MEHDTLRPEEAPPARRLVRTPGDRVLSGVCGGLGRYFDLDPVIFRIAFAALTLAGGAGVLMYVVAWVAIPQQGKRRSIADGVVRTTSHGPAIGAVLLAVAAIVIVGNLFDGGLGAAVLLMAAGGALLVWRRDDSRAYDDEDDEDEDTAVTSSGYVRYRDDAAPRPRSHLGRATFAVLLLLAGLFAGGHATGAFDASVDAFLAVALLITGLALIVGSRFGRARGLIPLGVLLVALTAAATFVDVPLRGGVGERLHQPASVGEIRDEYRLLAGQLVIDLTDVRFGADVTDIEASVAAGELRVLVPAGVDVHVDAEAAAGEVVLFGAIDHGVGVDVSKVDDRGEPGRLELHLEVGGGRVEVERAAA